MTSPTTNRRYGVSSGTAIKAPCRVGTTVNITLSGLQSIDGVTTVADDRVLVKNQSNTVENGIYVAASGTWSRDVDCDDNRDIQNGTTVLVTSGGQAKTFWVFVGTNPIVPGSSAISIVVAPQTQPVDISTSTALATGASSTRTIAAYFSDTINVKNFGAVGDGATDDTTSVQAAYTYAATKNFAEVYFPPGIYLITGVNITGVDITTRMYGAEIVLKVQAALTGTPIFRCKAATCTFLGGYLQGQAASQPADGFNDSLNGGAQGQGRAYRAGIYANAADGCNNLYVCNTYIYGTYGAAIATKGLTLASIDGVKSYYCYFELYYQANAALQDTTAKITNCQCFASASGDAVVNAYGIYVKTYTGAPTMISGNTITNCERNGIYAEGGITVNIENNMVRGNTKDNYAGIAVDATTWNLQNAIVSGNNLVSCGAGVKCTGTNLLLVTILGNQIYTTTGSTSADGISIVQGATINIANNALHDIKRHGIIVSGQTLNFICTGNTVYGKATATSYGLQLNATTGSWPNAVIRNNIFSNFEGAAGGLGLVNFTRSAAYVFTIMTYQNNIVLTGADGNKGFSDGGVALFTNAQITDCSFQGFVNITSTSMRMNNNFVSGYATSVMPANTANFELGVSYRTTVGVAGGATALPATPLGYIDIFVNGVQKSVPYYNP